jgi:4,4'-diaponeurosporenoate glycosyltransferase
MSLVTLALSLGGLVTATLLMWRVRGVLPASGGPPSTTAEPTVVIVPCRNEEHRLPRLLASLAAQTEPAAHVVVVDDVSTDATAAVARAGGAAVVTPGPPPEGWQGKPWACAAGVAQAAALGAGRLVLLDADVWLAPDALVRLQTTHDAEPDGLLSVQPYHHTERAYEQLSAVANIVPVMASGLAAVAPPRRSAVAFGPCLVTAPDALAAAGGFAAVRSDVVEDAALARRYGAAGRPVRCLAGRDAVMFRMYEEGVGQLLAGWAKNLAGGAGRAAPLPTFGAALWVAGALSVFVAAWADPGLGPLVLWGAYAAQTAWMLRRLGRFQLWTAVLFPIPVAAFVGLFLASVAGRVTGRSVPWRGRPVAVGGR